MAGAGDVERDDIERGDGDHDEGRRERRRPGRPHDPGYDSAILHTTAEILAEKGYAGLTIDGVAARTGVGRPTIYRRWPSKPALVIAALAHSTGLSSTPNRGTLRADLLAFLRQQATMMDRPESRRITAGLVADLVADPELAEGYFGTYVAARQASVWQALQRGVDRGELRADADFVLIYDLLMGPLFMRSVVRGEQLGVMPEEVVDFVLEAFGRDRNDRRHRASAAPGRARADRRA